jgi:hypothetical protein
VKKGIHAAIFFFFMLVFLTGHIYAGDTTLRALTHSINFYYNPGLILPTNDFVRGENPMGKPYIHYQSFNLQYGIQTDGRKLWQQLYGYPVWGFGAYTAYFPGDHELGYPLAFYTYMEAPFKRWKKWSINYELNLGMSFNWKSHYYMENGYRYPISSFMTFFFDFGINTQVQLSKHLDMYLGLNFTHFCNGSIKLPNYGINLLGIRVGVNYIFNERPQYLKTEHPHFEKEWEWLITFSPSLKQVGFQYVNTKGDTAVTVFNYGIVTVSSGVNKQLSRMIKVGAGIDMSYNNAFGADTIMLNGTPEKAEASFGKKFLIGTYPSFELVVNDLTILVQLGFYIYKPKIEMNNTYTSYQRIGLRYYFQKRLILGINVRAYSFSKADFVELNIGYSIKWKKNITNY